MPWCSDCSRFWTPSSMREDGSCPTCGRLLATAPVARVELRDDGPFVPAPGEEVEAKVPWHFWLLVVAVTAYLGWRVVQMIGWLVT